MPQPTRCGLAAASLTAVLLLAVPAPSRAAGFPVPPAASAVAGRICSWLESLFAGAPAARPVHSSRRVGKTATTTTTTSNEPSPVIQQGSMVDPNGAR